MLAVKPQRRYTTYGDDHKILKREFYSIFVSTSIAVTLSNEERDANNDDSEKSHFRLALYFLALEIMTLHSSP